MNNKTFRFTVTASVILLMVILSFMAACAQPPPAPSPSPAASPKPAVSPSPSPSATPAKVWSLRFHTNAPPKGTPQTDQGHQPYADRIEKATGGRVKVTVYPASTLVKANEAYDALVRGSIDMAWGFTGFFPGQFPMTDITLLPLLGISRCELGAGLVWSLYQKFPTAFAKEFSEVKLLSFTCAGAQELCTSKKPVRTLEDMKGLNVRTPGGPPTDLMKALGANPMLMDLGDIYTSMEKGVIDGYTIDWAVVEAMKLHEVTKYFTELDIYVPTFWIAMNKNVWDSMPPDVQQQVMSVNGEDAARSISKAWDTIEDNAKEAIKNRPGKEIIKPSPQEFAKWQEAAKPIWNAYVDRLASKGLPGRDVLNEALNYIKQNTK